MQQAAQSRLLTAFLSALSITAAFGLAFWWNLDKPFWAGFSALVVSLSTLGQSIQKGLLRMVGTVTGAAAGLILYFFWGQLRWPMLVMLCLYILLMVFLLLRSRQSSYFFYTSAIVAILIVVQSRGGDTPFTVAVDRMQETLLGILVYTVLALLLWPRSSLEALKAGVFRITAGFGGLLAARRAPGADAANPVELNLYQAARDAVKLTRRTVARRPLGKLRGAPQPAGMDLVFAAEPPVDQPPTGFHAAHGTPARSRIVRAFSRI